MSEQLLELTSNEGLHPKAMVAMEVLQTKGVTLASEKALMRHCNPFPDKDLEPILIPDGAQAVLAYPSMKQLSLSKPSGLTAGTKWGFCIVLHPLADTSSQDTVMYDATTGSYSRITAEGQNPLNGFQAGFCFDDLGQDLDLIEMDVATGSCVALPAGLQVDSTDLLGNVYKVVAQGFEASDVTPELYKGGTFCAAEWEPLLTSEQALVTRTGPVTDREVVTFVANWPELYSTMPTNKTFVQWPAPKGCYAMNTFRRNCNHKFTQKQYNDVLISPKSTQDSSKVRIGDAVRDNGFKVKVLVFRGLDTNAVFSLRRVIYFETQVSPTDATYKLAVNEPPYDPNFNRLVTEVARSMPVCTHFNGNALGSWFDTVCDVVSGIGSAVGGMFPGVGGLIGGGVASAAKFAKGVNNSFRTPSQSASMSPAQVFQKFLPSYEEGGITAVPRKYRAVFMSELEREEGDDGASGSFPPRMKRSRAPKKKFITPVPEFVPVPSPTGPKLMSTRSPEYKAIIRSIRKQPWNKVKGKKVATIAHKKKKKGKRPIGPRRHTGRF